MDFLFKDEDYNKYTTNEKAAAKCKKDLEKRVKENKDLKNIATENAKITIEALTKPLLDSTDEKYELVFK